MIFFQIEEMVIAGNKIATIRVNRSSQNMVVLGIIVNDIEDDFPKAISAKLRKTPR
ncbi:hypothetical protein HUU40_28155 [candidate division KSB1 bacterium]|nr:hypothetical protein [candidate division KSB1 bacterium]